jgi:hypothetical protein
VDREEGKGFRFAIGGQTVPDIVFVNETLFDVHYCRWSSGVCLFNETVLGRRKQMICGV